MYATFTLEMPVDGRGVPIADFATVLKRIVPDVRHGIAEGITRGRKHISLGAASNGILLGVSVSWQYSIHAEIGSPHPTGET